MIEARSNRKNAALTQPIVLRNRGMLNEAVIIAMKQTFVKVWPAEASIRVVYRAVVGSTYAPDADDAPYA